MKHKLNAVASVSMLGALLGCAQLSPAPTLGQPAAVPGAGAAVLPPVQPVERISNPVSEVEGLFILARSAHGGGQLALAEERYEQVLSKQPSHLGALNAIAVIYAQTERIDKALQFFSRALALDPQASHVHNNFGYVLLQNGQLAEAELALKRAQDLNPSNLQTRQNMERLTQSRARASTLTALTGQGGPAQAASAGPQLVAVAPHIYELRDRPASVSAQTQAPPSNGLQAAKPAASAAGDFVAQDRAIRTSLRGVRIEVSNGVGIRYLARRTAQRLAPMGVVTARLTNQARYQQLKTEIQFGAGQKDAADALSAQFPVAVSTVAAARLGSNIQIRLVLGHDLTGKAMAAWLESDADIDLALAGETGWRWS